jgi:phage repressor protein C with HTH and peptisase S24 domain
MMSEDERKALTAALIQRRLDELGRDMADFARATGVSFTSARNWTLGINLPTTKRIPAIASFLDLSERDILAAVNGPADDKPKSLIEPLKPIYQREPLAPPRVADIGELGPRNVPILGVVVGGQKADFTFDGYTIGYARRPAAIADLANVYAMYVTGSSMDPRFRDGELVYVHRREPAVGDDVVIQLKPDVDGGSPPGFIKRLVRRNGTHIICEQYKPAGEIRYEREDILQLDRVIPWHELLAV